MRLFMAVCLVVLSIVTVSTAEEMPGRGNPNRYKKTLEGMPVADGTPAPGRLRGSIQTVEGVPLSGGDVYFFNEATGPAPAPEKYWRVADRIATLDDRGGFSVELSPGRYYVGAIQRKGDKRIIGPPSEGDLFYAGKTRYEVLSAVEKSLEPIKEGKQFTLDLLVKGEGVSAIEGVVLDVAGKPVENAMVFGHVKSAMNDRPLFVSKRTDSKGAYQLRVAGNGTYYLRVRDIYGGGMPSAGAVMGVFGGDKPKAVIVKEGEIVKGINLTEVEFVKPSGKQQGNGGK